MEFDLVQLVESIGYVGIAAVVFAESGLFFGFFLPGDSLLLTSGLLASRGVLNITILVPLIFTAAVLGDNVGYWFGNKVGPSIFNRPNSRIFKRKNLLKAKEFYDKYGVITIVAARFVPFIRTFAPIVAGAVAMDYRKFVIFNLVGGIFWGIGLTMLGYLLGIWLGSVEGIDRYFSLVVLVFFFVPGLPTAWHLWQENREQILAWLKDAVSRKPNLDKESEG
jgi:membrane-associated protein